jgi:hypothetical protein
MNAVQLQGSDTDSDTDIHTEATAKSGSGSGSKKIDINSMIHEYDVDNMPIFINYIYSLQETIFPAIVLFLSGLGLYGVAKDVKIKTDK